LGAWAAWSAAAWAGGTSSPAVSSTPKMQRPGSNPGPFAYAFRFLPLKTKTTTNERRGYIRRRLKSHRGRRGDRYSTISHRQLDTYIPGACVIPVTAPCILY